MTKDSSHVFSIPAGIPFAGALAGHLLEITKDEPEALASYRILLPTRRACRTVQEQFLRQSEGKPLLLPHLQPLGDVDEEELSLALAGEAGLEQFLDLPPGISPLHRRILLARLIEKKPDFKQDMAQALVLAEALGHLMDRIYTEGLSMDALSSLVPEEFADHWQITLTFLEILSVEWPKILAENGVMDRAERRNHLLRTLNALWQKIPPDYPVIAAGTTGSIPATADLLKTISSLPHGQVVLPGLDVTLDNESWAALEESHPQFGFRHLLDHMEVERDAVQTWPIGPWAKIDKEKGENRRFLASEIMRPAAVSPAWKTLGHDKDKKTTLIKALENLTLYECAHEREEAELIATLMRETLETPGKTAALITPNRTLARRVCATCRRWNITVDDSAGQTLNLTEAGLFIRLVFDSVLNRLAPVPLLSLLKHPFCRTGPLAEALSPNALERLEKGALRGPKPPPGFCGLEERLGETPIVNALKSALGPLYTLCDDSEKTNPFRESLKRHIAACEAICGSKTLWTGESGQALATFLANLMEHAPFVPDVSPSSYIRILEQLMSTVTLRPAYGMHPRLIILGQLEARLLSADLVILGGLNEGTWPSDPGHDPWMSRPMRRDFGLPAAERATGLAAHDFVQSLCLPHVALTRSQRAQGAQTVPTRWLQRLATVLESAGLSYESLKRPEPLNWVRSLDTVTEICPAERPAPCPPPESRPRRLSVTKIETWMKDPYAIYAAHILNLSPLEDLNKEPDAALYGQVLHEILDNFVKNHPGPLPENAAEELQATAADVVEKHCDDPALWSFWWPRFYRLGDWFLTHEREWRTRAKTAATEHKGSLDIQTDSGTFTLTGVADRIDRVQGGYAIIDYKSGGQYSTQKIRNGGTPQLPLEALILSKGGFPGLAAMPVEYLGYWILTGGMQAGKISALTGQKDVETTVRNTEEGLRALITAFENPAVPYLSLPYPAQAPRFNDYEHLARVQEWSTQDTVEEEAA